MDIKPTTLHLCHNSIQTLQTTVPQVLRAYVSPNTTGSLALGDGSGPQGGYSPTGNELQHP